MNAQSKVLTALIAALAVSTTVIAQPNTRLIARIDARFDSPDLKIGIGFSDNDPHRSYRYSREEERLLVALHQTRLDLRELKQNRANLMDRLEEMYSCRHFSRKQVRRMEWQIKEINRDIRDTQRELAMLEREWQTASHRETCSMDDHFRYLEQNYRLSPNRLNLQNGRFRYSEQSKEAARLNPDNNRGSLERHTIPQNYAMATPSNTLSQTDLDEYYQKKQARIDALKNRTIQ